MTSTEADPELAALPAPRRPWRLHTLLSMALLALCSVALGFGLLPEASYALVSGQPVKVGDLAQLELARDKSNTWVQGRGFLEPAAVGYRRPLDSDRFRLAQIEGNPRLWVELREPGDTRAEYFLPPTSFVGRLVPLNEAGLSHSGLREALSRTGQLEPPPDAWLLVDGQSPSMTRWVLGVGGILLAFLAFSVWGTATLLRPVRY